MKSKIIFSLLLTICCGSSYAQVSFINGGWPEALEKARKEQKYIFVDAMTDWCIWCKEMDRRTFSKPEVGDAMLASFIPVQINMEKDFGVKLAMKFRVSSFPTYLVFSPDGQLVYRLTGFMESEPFLAELNKSLEPDRIGSFKGITSEINIDFPDFYLSSFKGNASGKVVKADSITVSNYIAGQPDLFSEINWSVMTRFIKMLPSSQQFILEHKEQFKALYGEQEVMRQIENIIRVQFTTAIEKKDERMMIETLQLVGMYLDDPDGKMRHQYQASFYKGTSQWIKLDKIVTEYINTWGADESINDYAWTIYEKCSDDVVINDAIVWMQALIQKSPSYMNLDTYAALLYKNKQYAEAQTIALEAIAAGKEANEDVKETESLLEKIKKAPVK